MRSSASALMRLALLVLALCAGGMPAHAQAITVEEVEEAVEKLEADPNLIAERKVRVARWQGEEERSEPRESSGVFRWIIDLFRWLAQISRVLVWAVIAVVVAALAFYFVRLFRSMERTSVARLELPTHVRELDIRPESLPDDIGAAAWALWSQGEQRAALSLLYRGLLSRLVHVWRTPIRDSSTEGDCLQLAREHLPDQARAFAERLIQLRQAAVYGGRTPEADAVRELCDQFAATLAGSEAP